jgi:thiamine transporter ThiT
MNNRLEFGVSAAGALIAFAAILDLPSGLYMFVRLVLTAAAISLIVFSVRRGDQAWLFGLIPIALLWNPVIPVYLSRAVWLPLDLAAAAFFVVYAVSLAKQKQKQKRGRA